MPSSAHGYEVAYSFLQFFVCVGFWPAFMKGDMIANSLAVRSVSLARCEASKLLRALGFVFCKFLSFMVIIS